MGSTSGNDKILSYNDVVLRRSDLNILNRPVFLNDRLIEFYFSYLSTIHTSSSSTISLIPPSIAFWISNCPDKETLKDFVKPLKLRDSDLIIFPVNDNRNVELAEGGSHWSLLVYHKETNSFYHHDSLMGLNRSSAKHLFEVVSMFVCDGGDAVYREFSDSPQQKNGYDCGVYVLAVAKVVCEWFGLGEVKNRDEVWFSDVKETVPDLVKCLRRDMLELIKSLMSDKSF